MMKHWTVPVTTSLAALLALFAPAQVTRADIFEWEYINPANPALGKQQSTTLAPDGAGANAVPGTNLSNRNLTMSYLIGADLSPNYTLSYFSDLTGANLSQADLTNASLYGAVLTNVNFSQANLTNAKVYSATLTGANLTGAEVRGANLNYTGITAAQVFSTASYQAHDLSGIGLSYVNLTGGNLGGQNLTNASLESATLTNVNFSQANLTNAILFLARLTGANLTGAEVRGANLNYTGITAAQLYSTASYQAHDLSPIGLCGSDLTGVNLAGQNLTNAAFQYATLTNANLSQANLTNADFGPSYLGSSGADLTGANLSQANLTNANFAGVDWCGEIACETSPGANLTNANLSGADARGAFFQYATLTGANTSNLIQANGHIAGLNLTAGASLVVRDYDGNPYYGFGPIPIKVDQHLAMDATGTLRLVFDADPWDSLISFAPGIPVTRGGALELTFASDVNLASQVGRTIDLFDWTGVNPTGAFTISSPYTWNLSKLYTTGEVTLTALPAIPGDFNNDGVVDAADYVIWRKGGVIAPTQDNYNLWRANFGRTVGQADVSGSTGSGVPEPASLALVTLASVGLLGVQWKRTDRCR